MKKILLSMLMLTLVVGGVAAGTRAYFFDTETSTGNTFVAGSLDLELNEGELMPFNISDVVPGDSGEGTFILTNTQGSIPGKLSISLKNFLQFENTLTEPELNPPFGTADYEAGANAGELNFFLQMAMFVDVNQDGTFNTGDIQLTYNGQQEAYPGFWNGNFNYHPVGNMLSAWNDIMTMTDGQSVNLVVMWQFPGEEPGGNYSQNIAMTDSLQFDIEFLLNQIVTP